MYNLTIEPTYNSFKTYIGSKWPYMKVIYDLKSNTPFVKNKPCILFSSYSYLNNHADKTVQQYAIKYAIEYSTGNHGPRLLLGNTSIMVKLEKELASFFNKEACMVSSDCYSIFKALCSEPTIIFADALCHVNLVSAFQLSGAKVVYFKHNCKKSLELLLNWYFFSKKQKIVVSESLFGKDGSICELPVLRKLCNTHNAILVIDEDNGLGTLGKYGKGIQDHYNMPNSVDIIVGTFAKSISNLGGFVCGSNDFISKCEYANIFASCLSAYHSAGAFASLKNINENNVRKLLQNTKYLRQKLNDAGFDLRGHENSPIIPVVFQYDVFKLIDISQSLHHDGFAVSPIFPPVCSIFEPHLCITATSSQSHTQIDIFVRTLKLHTSRYISKLNRESLHFLRMYKRFIKYNYLYRNLILTIWTSMLGGYPILKTFGMKCMSAMLNCYNFFTFNKIFKTNSTI
jgi:7-keto-8-aminopelargonate synthetase-like enzyme